MDANVDEHTGEGRPGPLPATEGRRSGISLRLMAVGSFGIACLLSVVALAVAWSAVGIFSQISTDDERYIQCESAVDELELASDYLTSQSRMYVVTADRKYLDNYFSELQEVDRRGHAIQVLESYRADTSSVVDLKVALGLSNDLAEWEIHAMKLVAVAHGLEQVPDAIAEDQLSAAEQAASDDEKIAEARSLVLGEEYDTMKQQIMERVEAATSDLIADLHEEQAANHESMQTRLNGLLALVAALFLIVLVALVYTLVNVLKPIDRYIESIRNGQKLDRAGSSEMRYFADAYNAVYDASVHRTMQLRMMAEHDGLTGLKNRRAYDIYISENHDDIALIIVDVDHFKQVNDKYGHTVGDAVLKKVADAIRGAFRSSDFTSRIGGDEFAIIMTRMRPELRAVVEERIASVRAAAGENSDGTPPVTLSIGVAFGGADSLPDEVFRKADGALYLVKEKGRDGYAFAGDGGGQAD